MREVQYSEEISGRFILSYFDKEDLWAYDEVSMGLYKINLNTRIAELMLTSFQINKYKKLKIRGIIKRNTEIILIPQVVNDSWIVYETKKNSIEYVYPFTDGFQIVEVWQKDDTIYLLPINANEPILFMSLIDLKCIKQIKEWNNFIKKNRDKYLCWGSDFDGINIFFPIVRSNYICKISEKTVKIMQINIPDTILSISIEENNIWILPVQGNYIYQIDKNGKFRNRVELKTNFQLYANQFWRIVDVAEYLFLFPCLGRIIYVYKKNEKQFIEIDSKASPLWGEFLVNSNYSYWNYHINDGKLHLLPMRYRYLIIDLLTLEINDIKLYYREPHFEVNQYSWYYWALKNNNSKIWGDTEDNTLKELIQLINKVPFEKKVNYMFEKGKKIWTFCKG